MSGDTFEIILMKLFAITCLGLVSIISGSMFVIMIVRWPKI